MKKLVDIIIIRYCTPLLDINCIGSLIDKTTYPFYKLTVWDNSYLNENLSLLWNRLISNSQAEYICLLNNDTVITDGGWLTKLVETMDSNIDIAVVGPSTDGACNQQKQNIEQLPSVKEEIDFAKFHPIQMEGFCFLMRKSAWLKAGKFNPSYSFYGQETELFLKIQRLGGKTIWRKDAYVKHLGRQTAKERERRGDFNIQLEMDKAQKLYREKI